ncbi:MAG TPA: GNAT family N-acetyltransferase [Polyangia bacterium]|nr:GNAT family N-acetyltransferase [Polyangia bacterium]
MTCIRALPLTYHREMFAARLATDADVPIILTMMADFNAIEAIPFDPAVFAPRVHELVGRSEVGGLLVFTVDGSAAGYAIVTWGWDLEFGGRDAFLTELYVAAERRRHGVGRQGLAAAQAFARVNGAHALHLLVRHENAAARALYEAAGFATQPRLVMTKPLG